MKNIFIALFLLVSTQVFSQEKSSEIQKHFPFYDITSFESGMQFMVEAESTELNKKFRHYQKKGKGKKVKLSKHIGEIFTFKRYETRETKVKGEKLSVLYLVFEKDGEVYEYNTENVKDELHNEFSDKKKNNIEQFLFYDDVLKAKEVFVGKEFYSKSLSFTTKGYLLYKVLDIQPNEQNFPIKITFKQVTSGEEFKSSLQLSGTNENKKALFNMSIASYLITKEEYAKIKQIKN